SRQHLRETRRRRNRALPPLLPSGEISDGGEADRTGNACTTEPAIPAWVLGEILLMVVLGVIERRRRQDLRRDLAERRVEQAALVRVAGRLRGLALGLAVV